ncbi:MAG: hypothetical protein WC878_02000 [Candidatus Paceibacterota bacterium]|jgi:hypothetical protein
METENNSREKNTSSRAFFWLIIGAVFFSASFFVSTRYLESLIPVTYEKKETVPPKPVLDIVAYDQKMKTLANNAILSVATSTATSTFAFAATTTSSLWPVKTTYPNAGAILPFNRIIAYYGNLYSKGMGVLGEYPEDEMLARLDVEMAKWRKADPKTPPIPALHYIAATAQSSPGKEGKYLLRMPDEQIDKVLRIAKKRNAIVFLDLQVGLSTLQKELPYIEKYLKMPNVHLGIDPEFSMKTGARPGTVVGTFDAADINYAAEYLAKLVRENDLPPKVLVVHRYTQKMVTNYKKIKPLPEVQIVMHMDGWGGAAKKKNTYRQFIYSEPVQFTGFKLFYKNDVFDPGTKLMTPEELLTLTPRPVYIQYQ